MKKVYLIIVMLCFAATSHAYSFNTSGADNSPTQSPEKVVWEKLKIEPGFNGKKNGKKAFRKWLSEEIKNSRQEGSLKIEGTVMASFIVTPEGKLSDIEVFSSTHPALTLEVLRLVQNSPDWTPGYDRNMEPVSVRYDIPVRFKLPVQKKAPAYFN